MKTTTHKQVHQSAVHTPYPHSTFPILQPTHLSWPGPPPALISLAKCPDLAQLTQNCITTGTQAIWPKT